MKTKKHCKIPAQYMSAAELQEEVIAELRRRATRLGMCSTAIETDGSRRNLLRARWSRIVATERS